jgi:hypothetical protein
MRRVDQDHRSVVRAASAGRFPALRLAALVGVLTLAGATLLLATGAQPSPVPTKLPPVTGPAGNGLIAFSREGDIVVGDPLTGESRVIATGSLGMSPEFSPDGTRIAYGRGHQLDPKGTCDIVVIRPDGSDERVIATRSDEVGCGIVWSPDGSRIMVRSHALPESPWILLDASGLADPVPLPDDARPFMRPPAGDRVIASVWQTPVLSVMDLDGSDVVDLGESSGLRAMGYDVLADPSWAPDGSRIAVLASAGHERHLYVMEADGSDLRRLAAIPWHEGWEGPPSSWSPNGATIAVQAARLVEPSLRDTCSSFSGLDHCGEAMWVTLIDVESGEERVLDTTHSPYEGDGALLAWSWSPDGQAILVQREFQPRLEVVDVPTDTATELPWDSHWFFSWQRVAAE